MNKIKCKFVYLFYLVLSIWIVTTTSETHLGAKSKTEAGRNEPFCRITRNIRKSIQQEFIGKFGKDIDCYLDSVYGNCSSVSCSTESWENVTAGLNINICDDKPNVNLWVDSPILGRWSEEFYVSKNVTQKVEIKFSKQGENNTNPLLYLIVNLESHEPKFGSQNVLPSNLVYLSLEVKLSAAEEKSLPGSIYPLHVINRTEFHLSQVCDLPVPPEVVENRKTRARLSVTKISGAVVPDMYNPVKRASVPTAGFNRPCKPNDIFGCGNGATCRVQEAGIAFCECLTNYVLSAYGKCERSTNPAPDPTVQPSSSATSNTYSSVLGAFFSVIMLVVIAAAIFFGTKYHVFSRIRSRFSSGLSLWPFRDTTLDDHVVMVDPLAPEDDDPPLF